MEMGDAKGTPRTTELIVALASTEVAVVQAALDQLATLTLAASTAGTNAITTLLGLPTPSQAGEDEDDVDDDDDDDDDVDDDVDDDDEEGDDGGDDEDDEADEGDDDGGATIQADAPHGALPPIDQALDLHLAQLAPATLAQLFRALFQACRDNFPAAARIAAEIARRGDDAAQLVLVDAFITANEHHAPGPRTEDAVHDVVIDEVFPTLRAPALTWLLAWCTSSHLDDASGDRMFALFAPALAGADEAERAILVGRLELFMREILDVQPERADALRASLDSWTGPALAAVAALPATITQLLDGHR